MINPIGWDKRADLWFLHHPIPKLILDGLAVLALGVFFAISFLLLIPWEPSP